MSEENFCPECKAAYGPLDHIPNGSIVCSACGHTVPAPVDDVGNETPFVDIAVSRPKATTPKATVSAKASDASKPPWLIPLALGSFSLMLLMLGILAYLWMQPEPQGSSASRSAQPAETAATPATDNPPKSNASSPQPQPTEQPATQQPPARQTPVQKPPQVVQWSSEDPAANENVRRLIDATVLVQWAFRQETVYTTGLVMLDQKGISKVMTVIPPRPSVAESQSLDRARLTCHFRPGTPQSSQQSGSIYARAEDDETVFIQFRDRPDVVPLEFEEDASIINPDPSPQQQVMLIGFDESISAANPSAPVLTSVDLGDRRENVFGRVDRWTTRRNADPPSLGGPLIDSSGRLVGIMSPAVSASADDPGQADGGTAIIPADRLQNYAVGSAMSLAAKPIRNYINGEDIRFQATIPHVGASLFRPKLLLYQSDDPSKPPTDATAPWATLEMKSDRDDRFYAAVEISLDDEPIWCQLEWNVHEGPTMRSPLAKLENVRSQTYHPEPENSMTRLLSAEPKRDRVTRLLPFHSFTSDYSYRTQQLAVLPLTEKRVDLIACDQRFAEAQLERVSYPTDELPSAVVFKRFGETEYLIVGCRDGGIVHLRSLSDLSQVKTIQVELQNITDLAASESTEDPFCYVAGIVGDRDSIVRAVDLRTMSDVGQVISNAVVIETSPDGSLLYGLNSGSPTSFKFWHRIGNPSDSPPRFSMESYAHDSRGGYAIDPRGNFIGAGSHLYSPQLWRMTRSLSIYPAAFFRELPLMVGTAAETFAQAGDMGRIGLASTNSFDRVGEPFTLTTRVGPHDERVLIPGMAVASLDRNDPRRKRLAKAGGRVHADDQSKSVIAVHGNRVLRLPLKSFQAVEEPNLRVQVENRQLVVGRESDITIQTAAEGATIDVEQIPINADVSDQGLKWKPTVRDVGRRVIPIRVSVGDSQLEQGVEFDVTQPFIRSPARIRKMLADPKGRYVVIWSGPAFDDRGKPRNNRSATTPLASHVAVVPLRSGVESRLETLPFAIKDAVLWNDQLLAATYVGHAVADQPQAVVLDLKTMKTVKSLLAAEPVQSLALVKNELHLQHDRGADVYALGTFKQQPSITGHVRGNRGPAAQAFLEGVLVDGVLRVSLRGKPLMILNNEPGVNLSILDGKLARGKFLHPLFPAPSVETQPSPNQLSRLQNPRLPRQTYSITDIDEGDLSVTIAVDDQSSSSEEGVRPIESISLLVADPKRQLRWTIPVTQQWRFRGYTDERPYGVVRGGYAFIATKDRIYRVSLLPPAQTESASGDSNELRFVAKQSTLVISGAKTTLMHEVVGGKAPYEFFLVSRGPGYEIDDSTGRLTLDGNALMSTAAALIGKGFQGERKPAETIAYLEKTSKGLRVIVRDRIGRSLRGMPVGVPVRVKVVDADGKTAEIQYVVFLDVPLNQVTRSLQNPS